LFLLEAGCSHQNGVDDGALLRGHAVGLVLGYYHLKDLLTEMDFFFQLVSVLQNLGLSRDLIADYVNSCDTAPR
jgi:hypothetical protein